jgi:hypothetical protein
MFVIKNIDIKQPDDLNGNLFNFNTMTIKNI